MSFGLLTAVNVDDIPKILRRVAQAYRNTQTRRFRLAWRVAADEIDRFADELVAKIDEAKIIEPVPKRERVRLDEDC